MGTVTTLDSVMHKLTSERDELRVKVNLAGKEIRDEWQQAEALFERLQNQRRNLVARAADVGSEAVDASGDVWEASKLLAEEVSDLFQRIGKKMKA